MLRGDMACRRVGFPSSHARVFQRVATQMNTTISCREVGRVCTGLIEEGYALKGFRIDTKSCDWGPMAGFVLMDPRLSKAVYGKEQFNRVMTEDALSGEIHKDGGTDGLDKALLKREWKANFHPLVISRNRIDQLVALGAIGALQADTAEVNVSFGTAAYHGTSSKGGLTLTWRLIRLRPGLFTGVGNDHYGIFVEADPKTGFIPEYHGGARPFVTQVKVGHGRYVPYHALYGLTNPVYRPSGVTFKDCVTGDYDLFGVWPRVRDEGRAPVARPSAAQLQIAKARITEPAKARAENRAPVPQMGKGPGPESNWDVRPQGKHIREQEHYQLGNISRRVNLIKVMLNTQLQVAGSGAIGATSQLVHHSDEVGNPDALLAKPLGDCLPIIGFIPDETQPYTMESLDDIKQFIALAKDAGYTAHTKPEWRADLGDG